MKLNGNFIQVPKSVFQRLYLGGLTLREVRVLAFIIEHTYGYHHDEWKMSNTFVANGVGLKRPNTIKAIRALEQKGIIKIERSRGKCKWIGFSDIDGISADTICSIPADTIHSIPADTQNNKDKNNKDKNNKDIKHPYGEYKNVLLTDEELTKLRAEIPQTDEYIGKLSAYIAGTGKKYKSHYATIRTWYRRDNPAPQPQETETERNRRLYTVDMSKW